MILTHLTQYDGVYNFIGMDWNLGRADRRPQGTRAFVISGLNGSKVAKDGLKSEKYI